MVFRRESNKVDSFHRQMNALRQQIGTEDEDEVYDVDPEPYGQPVDRAPRTRPVDEGYSFGTYPSGGQQADFGAGDMPAVPEMPQADQQVSIIAAGTAWNGDVDTRARFTSMARRRARCGRPRISGSPTARRSTPPSRPSES
jgi:hypothetical protein